MNEQQLAELIGVEVAKQIRKRGFVIGLNVGGGVVVVAVVAGVLLSCVTGMLGLGLF